MWIAVALILAIIEVANVSLVAGFVAVGAVGAAIAAFLGLDLIGQSIVFALVSLVGVLVVRRPLLRYLESRQGPEIRSGAAGMIGQVALVVDPIAGPLQRGHVRIAGEDWPALSRDGRPVEQGATIRVVGIRGTTLLVEPAVGVG